MDKLKDSWIKQTKSIAGKFCIDGHRIAAHHTGIFLTSTSGNCMATCNAYHQFAQKAATRVTPRGKAWLKALENSTPGGY